MVPASRSTSALKVPLATVEIAGTSCKPTSPARTVNFFCPASSPATKLLAPSIEIPMPAITKLTIRLFIAIPFDNVKPDCEGAPIISP